MQSLALTYDYLDRLDDSIALYERVLETERSAGHENNIYLRLCFAYACQQAGKLDRAERLLRDALERCRKQPNSLGQRTQTANTCGWLARTLLLKKQYDAAEPLVREALAFFEKELPDNQRRFYWVSLLGAVLVGQEKYDAAEPLLLQGYQGMKQRETQLFGVEKRRLAEAGERVVRFYEATGQPEKARAWREKLKARTK
jgi:tetratricopeptide (TPR) repeat protein